MPPNKKLLDQNVSAGEYVTEIGSSDVLFGRGSGPNDHEGNIQFRELVAERKAEYMATNHRQTKATIAKSIVDQVFQKGGRFLKKLEPSEALKQNLVDDEQTMHQRDFYQVVGDDTIMEKAKQALRQNRNRDSSDGVISPKRSTQNTNIVSPPQQSSGIISATTQMMMHQNNNTMGGGEFSPPLTTDQYGGGGFDHGGQQMQMLPQNAAAAAAFDNQPTPVMSNYAEQQAMYAAHALQQQQQNLGGVGGFAGHQVQNNHNPLASGIGGGMGGIRNSGASDMTAHASNAHAHAQQQNTLQDMYNLDPEGYATYTTALDDPEDQQYFVAGQPQPNHQQQQPAAQQPPSQQQQQTTFNRRQFMEMAAATGNSSRRAGMLGGRKNNDPPLMAGNTVPSGVTNATANYGKRESLHLDEVFNPSTAAQRPSLIGAAAQSMQMSDLMESFKGMSTTEFNSSDDTIGTIGTIDNLGTSAMGMTAMSLAHMSGFSQMSMNMSTDSIFKSSVAGGGSKNSSMSSSSTTQRRKETSSSESESKKHEGAVPTTPTTAKASTPNSKQSHGSSIGDASLGSSDFWKSEQLHSLLQGPMESSSTNVANVFDHSHDYSGGITNTFRSPNRRLSITEETSANNDSSLPTSSSYEGQILSPSQEHKG